MSTPAEQEHNEDEGSGGTNKEPDNDASKEVPGTGEDNNKKKIKKASSRDDDDSSVESEESLRTKSRARLLLQGASQSFRKILGGGVGKKGKQPSITDLEVGADIEHKKIDRKKVALDNRKVQLQRQARSLREMGTVNGKMVMNKRNARSMRHVGSLGTKGPSPTAAAAAPK